MGSSGGRRADARGGQCARGGGRGPRPPCARDARCPRSADRPSARATEHVGGGGRGRGRGRGLARRPRGRDRAGRRSRLQQPGARGRIVHDGRAAARSACARRPRPQRDEQRRRRLRATGDPPGRRKRLRRRDPARAGRRVEQGALCPPRRPLRDLLPSPHNCRCRLRLGHLRRSGARPRGVRRRDAVPTDPRRTGGVGVRDLTRREGRRDRQGRWCHRAARQGPHGALRQDGHAHARDSRGRPRRRLRRDGKSGARAAGRVARPAVRPPAGRGPGPSRDCTGVVAFVPRARDRGARSGDRGRGRRQEGRRRKRRMGSTPAGTSRSLLGRTGTASLDGPRSPSRWTGARRVRSRWPTSSGATRPDWSAISAPPGSSRWRW